MSNVTKTVTNCFVCSGHEFTFYGYKMMFKNTFSKWPMHYLYWIKCKGCGKKVLGMSRFSMPTARRDAVKTWMECFEPSPFEEEDDE